MDGYGGAHELDEIPQRAGEIMNQKAVSSIRLCANFRRKTDSRRQRRLVATAESLPEPRGGHPSSAARVLDMGQTDGVNYLHPVTPALNFGAGCHFLLR